MESQVKGDTAPRYPYNEHKRRLSGRKLAAGVLLLYIFAYRPIANLLHSEQVFSESTDAHTDKINWTPCGEGFECGRLLVPMDHHNATRGYANLSVGRLLAKNVTHKLGSLFVNPGGPGGSGLSFLYRAGPVLSELLDNRYDIVSWDPRGINGTIPGVDCYPSQTAQDIAFSHTSTDIGFEVRNLSDPIDRAVFIQQARKADAENTVIAELCFNRSGEVLSHVGTATVVRDLELLARIIDGPEKQVNFWGFSYGTVIGSFFVNMFPHRVGNVAIDAVVDPIAWTSTGTYEWTKHYLVDIEKAYTHFLEACAEAGPTRCALATDKATTAADIGQSIDKLMDDLYARPLPVPSEKQPYILTSGMVRNQLFVGMYRPRIWGTLAEQLSSAMRGNGTPIVGERINAIELNNTVKPKTAIANEAILCVDGPDLRDAEPSQMLKTIVDEITVSYEKVSKHFAGIEISPCHRWKARSVERFVGPFNSTGLANDILIIGNTADPVTPLRNAQLVNRLILQSRLVIQDGSGHGSIAMASPCTGKAIRGYFLDGVLPPNGIVCKTVEKLFPDTAAPISGVEAWLNEEVETSEEDKQLAEKMRSLGQAMEPFVNLHKPKTVM